MTKVILDYIEKCEVWKTQIKALHWDAKNLSQHKLCDDIADRISEFQDQVSEVEQALTGNLPTKDFNPQGKTVDSLKGFVMDVIDESKAFLKKLEGMGDDYVGMKSDCESFISDMQRQLYLVNFTMKESFKRELKEAMYKNLPDEVDGKFDKFMGQHPKTMKGRINLIYKAVNKYGLSSRLYHDDHWQAVRDYDRVISSLGCEFSYWCDNGGYTDYAEDGMPRSKEYKVEITFEDGMTIGGYLKMMAAGTVEDPFSKYDTAFVLWPKTHRVAEGKTYTFNDESEVSCFVNEAVNKVLAENYDEIAKALGQYNTGSFTPNSKEDFERSRQSIFKGSPEERNSSYARAKKEAAERMARKNQRK